MVSRRTTVQKSAPWFRVIDLHKSEALTLTAGSAFTAAFSQYEAGGPSDPELFPRGGVNPPLQELIKNPQMERPICLHVLWRTNTKLQIKPAFPKPSQLGVGAPHASCFHTPRCRGGFLPASQPPHPGICSPNSSIIKEQLRKESKQTTPPVRPRAAQSADYNWSERSASLQSTPIIHLWRGQTSHTTKVLF